MYVWRATPIYQRNILLVSADPDIGSTGCILGQLDNIGIGQGGDMESNGK